MRVHPSLLAPKITRRQVTIGFGIVSALLLINLVAYPRKQIVQKTNQAAPAEKMIEVVIARTAVEPGQPLEKADLVLEQRPVSTLPTDVVTNFEAVKDKVAAGPIPARYPVSQAFLADPVTVVPVAHNQNAEPVIEDPIETLLKEIERDTVAVTLTFNTEAPQRGSRLALSLPKGKGEPILIVEDCWVSKSNGHEATLRLEPAQALIVQAAKSYGNFNFMELPFEGASPFMGQGMSSIDDLKMRMEGSAAKPKDGPAPAKNQPIGRVWQSDDPTNQICIYSDGHSEPCS